MAIERSKILNIFPPKDAHGREHANQTADLALKISCLPEYKNRIINRDRDLIEASSLVHDLGYLRREPFWSTVQWEHPYGALNKVDEMFSQFNEVERAMIKLVVLNHDITNHSFPAIMGKAEIDRFGYPEIFGVPSRTPGILADWPGITNDIWEQIPQEKFYAILQIIQEADGRLGDFQRTFDFSVGRRISIAANDGEMEGVGMPMWQHSALANVILAAKRCLLDAYTEEGKEYAWRMFQEAKEFVTRQIGPDNVGEILRKEDVENIIWKEDRNHFGRRFNENVKISQAFTLQGAFYVLSGLIPEIDLQKLKSRLIPLQEFVNREKGGIVDRPKLDRVTANSQKLKVLKEVRENLIRNYGFDILTETDGVLRVTATADLFNQMSSTGEYTLIPPIIDKYFTIFNPESKVWIDLAKQLGISKIRVLMID